MTPNPSGIFTGTAEFYAKYRRRYLPEIFTDLIAYFDLHGIGRLLDLGCGTGELTIPLAASFADAIGVDPNAEMLTEAKKKSDQAGHPSIQWIRQPAEDINLSLGPIRLTTAGMSFHWMNQPLVLKTVYAMTEDGGGMAILGEGSPVRGADKIEPWKQRRRELITKYLGPERRAGDHLHKEFIPVKRPFEELIAESPFQTFEMKSYEYETQRSIDEIIGFLYSTSYANKHLLGDHVDAFEREMKEELLQLEPSGIFIEPGKTDVFLMKK